MILRTWIFTGSCLALTVACGSAPEPQGEAQAQVGQTAAAGANTPDAVRNVVIDRSAYLHSEWAAEFYVIMHSLVSVVDENLSRKDQVLWLAGQARKRVPEWSHIGDMYDFVKAEYLGNPDKDDWEQTRDKVHERYQNSITAMSERGLGVIDTVVVDGMGGSIDGDSWVIPPVALWRSASTASSRENSTSRTTSILKVSTTSRSSRRGIWRTRSTPCALPVTPPIRKRPSICCQ